MMDYEDMNDEASYRTTIIVCCVALLYVLSAAELVEASTSSCFRRKVGTTKGTALAFQEV